MNEDVAEQLEELKAKRREWLLTRPRPKCKKRKVVHEEEEIEERIEEEDIATFEPHVKVEVKQEKYDPSYERSSARGRTRPVSYVEDDDDDWTWEGGDESNGGGGGYWPRGHNMDDDDYVEEDEDPHDFFDEDMMMEAPSQPTHRRKTQVKREPKAEVLTADDDNQDFNGSGGTFRCSRCDFTSTSHEEATDHVFGHSGRYFGCNYVGCAFRTDHPGS